MKPILLLAAALAATCCTSAANASLSGPLAPSTWTPTITGPAFGSNVDLASAPATVVLHGGDDPAGVGCPDGTLPGFVGGCEIRWTHVGPANLAFHWSFSTADVSPQYDSFGMLVDGVRIGLVANGGDTTQSGDAVAHAASSFAWYVNCSDCTGGASTAAIGNVTAIPEPATFALFAIGVAAFGARPSRRRVAVA